MWFISSVSLNFPPRASARLLLSKSTVAMEEKKKKTKEIVYSREIVVLSSGGKTKVRREILRRTYCLSQLGPRGCAGVDVAERA